MNTHTVAEWREIEAAWDRQDMQLKSEADDRSAARNSVAAIKAIRECDLTGPVVAQIVAAIRNRIGESQWSHWDEIPAIVEDLDDAVDVLERAGK